MSTDPLIEQYDAAVEIEHADAGKAIAAYRSILSAETSTDDGIRAKEQSIQRLGELLVKEKQPAQLAALVRDLRPFFSVIPKARTAKIVRNIIDMLGRVPDSADIQTALCIETVEWCRAEKRSFLRLRVQLRLAQLLLDTGKFQPALAQLLSVLREVKRLDDKQLLVEIHLLESRIHHGLRNTPKARAALVACRTAANSIYIGPELQADIDMQAGILHAEDKDYKTAYSYFYEAFEGMNSLDDPRAGTALKYMLLGKVMTEAAEEVPGIVTGKHGVKYAGRHLEAMRAVAQAYKDRSLHAFEKVLVEYSGEIVGDKVVSRHLTYLVELLLEANLLRIIEPFSRVEIAHVAELIGLPLERVEAKLSAMVLDKRFAGTLDAGRGQLLVFPSSAGSKSYEHSLKTVDNLNAVVDTLHKRAEKLK